MFQILNGYENIDTNICSGSGRREGERTWSSLAKKPCRLDIRQFSFSQRTVNEWNRLSADSAGASSVNIKKYNRHIPKTGGV